MGLRSVARAVSNAGSTATKAVGQTAQATGSTAQRYAPLASNAIVPGSSIAINAFNPVRISDSSQQYTDNRIAAGDNATIGSTVQADQNYSGLPSAGDPIDSAPRADRFGRDLLGGDLPSAVATPGGPPAGTKIGILAGLAALGVLVIVLLLKKAK